MATDAEILRAAYEKEHKPGRIARYAPWAWEYQAIGEEVYDRGLGDVRRARGIAQLMTEPTMAEVERALALMEKYRLPEELVEQNRKIQNKRFKRQAQAQLL